jgi:high-affinity iron transporter
LAALASRRTLAVLLLPVALAAGAESPPPAEAVAQRAIHLLDYVAVDYAGAVRDGAVVSETEYAEQLEFASQLRAELEALGIPSAAQPPDPLWADLADLERAMRARAPSDDVARRARQLGSALRERFHVRSLPPRTPSIESGREIYTELCFGCHGAAGRGDGPAAAGLAPRPADLANAARMRGLSPFALYGTISLGIDGTAMAPYAPRLGEAERWDLAFFAGTLALDPGAVERGRELAERAADTPGLRVPDLETLALRSAAEVASDADEAALLAWLRAHPEALDRGDLSLAVARSRLEASWAAYEGGQNARALDLAVSAYLDGFEPTEPALNAVDPALRADVEAGFLRYRAALHGGRPLAEVEPLYARLRGDLTRVEHRLAAGQLGPAAAFVGSLTILAREGLEAVLLVVAIATVVARAGRRDALRWIHAGWVAALGAGAATWWAAGRLVAVSGASRELVEGISALAATAILFYVSYWLVSKVEAARWQAFLDGRMKSALSRGSLGMLAMVSFVAVYRECFETVLFYEALAAQAGPGGARAIAAGIAAGTGLLAVLALAVFRFGQRLPMRRFFAGSSLFLYALAIMLAGQGVAALQEAGWLPVTPLRFARVEWLGVYPTAQGLALQGVLLLAALAALPRIAGGVRQQPAGG